MSSWDAKFMELAKTVAGWSKDRSTKVGTVIVGPDHEVRSTGYNGFPRGANDDIEARHQRPEKYNWAEHSERNAIYQAARIGVALQGCTLYTWADRALGVCVECSRAMVQAGIKEVVVGNKLDLTDPVWGDSIRVAQEILSEGGVAVRFLHSD